NLAGQGGSLSVSGATTVINPSGIGLQVQTAAAGASLSFGSTTVNGSGGTGVVLSNNTGSVSFGQLSIAPDAGQRGLLAQDNAGTITTTGGAISTSGAVAVEITRASGTTPLVVSLTSVAHSGGASGILLSNTSGSFTVNGDGASDTANTTRGRTTAKQGGGTLALGSGGTINNTSGPAVSLNNATNVTLRNVSLTGNAGGVNSGADGIHVTASSSLTLDNMLISGHAGNQGLDGSALSGLTIIHCDISNNATATGVEAVDVWNVGLANLTGAAAISHSNFDTSRENIFGVTESGSAVASITVSNCLFQNAAISGVGNDGISVAAANTANVSLDVSGSTFKHIFGSSVQYAGNDSSGGGLIRIVNNSFDDDGTSINIAHSGVSKTVQFNVDNNHIRDSGVAPGPSGNALTGISIVLGSLSDAAGKLEGFVTDNVVGTSALANSGSRQGIGIFLNARGAGTLTALIDNNKVREIRQDDAIFLLNSEGSAQMNVTISKNDASVSTTSGLGLSGLDLTAGVLPTDSGTICANILNNNVAFIGDPFLWGIQAQTVSGNPTINLQGYAGAQDDAAAIQSFLDTRAATVSPPSQVFVFAGHIKSAPSACGSPGFVPMSAGPDFSAASVKRGDGGEASADQALDSADRGVLRATWGEAANDPSVRKLSDQELTATLDAALYRWSQAGISAEDLARLRAVSFEVAELGGGRLAVGSSNHIRIDATAAGYGWFYDSSPDNDAEFDVPVPGRELQTTEFSPAFGRVDLLTVVTRELGYVYLQGKNHVPRQLRALMEGTLSPAVRRMPTFNVPDRSTSRVNSGAGQSLQGTAAESTPSLFTTGRPAATVQAIPAAFNQAAGAGLYGAKRMNYVTGARRVAAYNPPSGETVNLNVGTIPAGESVTITFQVTINSPLPAGVCSVTNVGHVTGSNFSPVDTNSDVTNVNKPLTLSACPADIVKNTDSGLCTAVVTFTSPTADGCPAATVTCSPASGTAFAKGVTTVTCTASNGVSPDASCTFTVTVNDN
ncbi:MAG TPA: HYR domain-containing protein, partial [Blastocatellia bacterium]|nr:HYR domain-containing protein [Blastocatellia bacterium]